MIKSKAHIIMNEFELKMRMFNDIKKVALNLKKQITLNNNTSV